MTAHSKAKKPRGRPRNFERRELIEQVKELFWSRGYNSLSFNEIAQETGLTRASLYNAFETKELLFFETLNHYIQTTPMAKLMDLEKGDSVAKAFRAFFKDVATMYQADSEQRGCMAVNCISELMGPQGQINQQITEIYEDLKLQLQQLMKQAIEQKELPKNTDVKIAAYSMLTFMNGISVFSKSKTTKRQLLQMSDAFMQQMGFRQAE